jgi:hypothetical protein
MEHRGTIVGDTNRPGQMTGQTSEDAARVAVRADQLLGEGRRLVEAVAHAGLTLRLTGGMAVRYYAVDRRFADRVHTDIDFVGLKREARALIALLGSLGYQENSAVSLATGNCQLQLCRPRRAMASSCSSAVQFLPVTPPDHIDVFLDAMALDHTLPMRDRLALDRYAISPADLLLSKLQVGNLAEKDVHDVIALCKDLPVESGDWPRVLNLRYLAEICADDWGLYTDVLANDEKVLAVLDGYQLSDQETQGVRTALQLARQMILDEPKSALFLLRARVGRRVPWRREVEETDAVRVTEDERPDHDGDGAGGCEDAAA